MTEQGALDRRLMTMDSAIDQHELRLGKTEKTLGEQHDELIRAKTAFKSMTEVIQELVKAKEKAEELPDPPFSWLTAGDPARAAEQIAALEHWLGEVLIYFPGGRLKDCWRRHPVVVEELLVLHDGHGEAWAPRGQVAARFDWLNRWVPETMKRVKVELEPCSGLTDARHSGADPDFLPARQPGLDRADTVHWTSEHGSTQAPPPSEEALVESRARASRARSSKYGGSAANR